MIAVIFLITISIGYFSGSQNKVWAAGNNYNSPYDVAYSPNGTYLAVSDLTKAQLKIITASTRNITQTVQLQGEPKGVAWSEDNLAYVAEYSAGSVAEINPANGTILRRFETGPMPSGIKISGNIMAVCDFGLSQVSIVDLETGSTLGDVTVNQYPMFLDITPNGNYAVVGHATPTGDATKPGFASSVTFVNIGTLQVTANIKLPMGSTNLRAVKCSPDENWVYIAHTFGKFTLPPTQLDKGWTNTNAISIINASEMTYYTTFLLDTMTDGAADPWGLAISSNSNTLWVSVSGIHEVFKVDLAKLHQLLKGEIPGTGPGTGPESGPFSSSAVYKFTNRASGLCLDVPGNSTANGTQMIQYTDNGGQNQQWLIMATSTSGYYQISNVSNNKYLDNYGSTANGAPINQYDQSSSNNQQWAITDLGGGYYRATCRTGGLAMDNGGSNNLEAGIVQSASSSSYSQQWKIEQIGSSTGGSSGGIDLLNRSKAAYDKPYSDLWFKIKADPSKKDMLKYDLSALWGAGLLTKTKLPGKGPRGISLSPNGSTIATVAYFAGELYLISAAQNNITSTISLGSQPEADSIRRGEIAYFDGSTTPQGWLSCATCHPFARTDGFNWDEANDGLGNYKNTKTHVNTFEYTPKTWRGIRPDAATSTKAGYKFAKFIMPTEQELTDVENYMRSLTAEDSPYRNANGTMTADALAGQRIFESSTAKCSSCHSGEYFTNMKKYDVGTVDSQDKSQGFTDGYIVPTLIELWRTAPYLHDGTAPTLMDVINQNRNDQHGKVSHLTTKEKEQLVAYMQQIPANGNTSEILIGDVNSDTQVNIVDALLIAQYYVSMNPQNFNPAAGDVNCSNNVDIVDALQIARYYTRLITEFICQ